MIKKIKSYWKIQPKTRLKHQDRWNGEVITPYRPNPDLTPVKLNKIYYKPKTQSIIRAFGDKLKEEC